MKKITFLLAFISIFGYAQTQLTDANFQTAINTCLSTNRVDGMCSNSEFGAMPEWDVSSVTYMGNMFSGETIFNGDISAWDVSSVTDMSYMFTDAYAFNGDISAWDVINVTDMSYMFTNAYVFNGDISAWDVSSATSMSGMFNDARSFNGDISAWDVSSVTDMSFMFYEAPAFNGNISSWDVSSVTDMHVMFYEATAFNQDIGAWDVSSVTSMPSMFSGAYAFNGDIGAWDVSSVTDMRWMFEGATSFNGDISTWDVHQVTNMLRIFNNAGLSRDNYDKLLNGWSQKNLQQNVSFGAVGINYCDGASGRQKLIDDFGWTITDGGLDCATAGLEEENLYTISMYPNPTDNTLLISGNESPIAVAIYNVLGKEVLSIKNTNNINVQALPSGVYAIRISDGVRQTNRKFIKN